MLLSLEDPRQSSAVFCSIGPEHHAFPCRMIRTIFGQYLHGFIPGKFPDDFGERAGYLHRLGPRGGGRSVELVRLLASLRDGLVTYYNVLYDTASRKGQPIDFCLDNLSLT